MYRGTITVDKTQFTELIEGNITYCSSIDCEIESSESVFHNFIDFKTCLNIYKNFQENLLNIPMYTKKIIREI